LIEV